MIHFGPSIPSSARLRLLSFLLLLCGLAACDKWKDPQAPDDPRLKNPYCNDPEAVNYNWGFPGRPDSTACIYPTDVFRGTYLYKDSLYRADGSFDSAGSQTSYTLKVYSLSRTKMALVGWCGPNDSLKMTADRFFKATADSTWTKGQRFCRPQDTISGTLSRLIAKDSFLFVNFTVVSDTGVIEHRGTARKQF